MGLRDEQNYVGLADLNSDFFEAVVAIWLEQGTDAAACFAVGC